MSNKKDAKELDILTKDYDLSGARSSEPQFYLVQHEVVTHASNGKRKAVDMYKIRLTCEPGDRATGETTDEYTCVNFSVKRNDTPEVTIPSLDGWSYPFSKQLLNEEGLDSQGQMMGIPHTKFDKLTDGTGAKLSIELPYQIYSAFTYFHTCCNILAEPDQFLKGIQDLKRIGEKIVSNKSYELPIDLGENILKGSTYKTGETTLEFKGLGTVDDIACAIVSYEEIGGSWTAYIKVMPLMTVKTGGGTQIRADIYIDLASFWVKKATYIVTDITKTTLFGIPVEIATIVTTHTIKAVPEAEF
jgi:hypothetical protein